MWMRAQMLSFPHQTRQGPRPGVRRGRPYARECQSDTASDSVLHKLRYKGKPYVSETR
jgi:hypothetical protein